MEIYNCIVVLGPTASGKTKLACDLAYELDGEIISADSRQVYKDLNIGTGKDLNEYLVSGQRIEYHLIDIIEPGEQYYLHQFAEDLEKAFHHIRSKGKMPIICGGSGLYLDALRKDFSFTKIKENPSLRKELENLSKEQLLKMLSKYPQEWIEHVDQNSVKRLIRAIEIAEERSKSNPDLSTKELPYKPFYIGINVDTELRRQRISSRLQSRLNTGMIEEVKSLIEKGISPERLEFLGLEYKFISQYLQGEFNREEMIARLETAIFQFAKRQMTWFRRMEKEGVKIHWLEPQQDREALLAFLEQNGVTRLK
ncbi:MAG: tRNA (adenosine(37)-N6)-dimethylallyltransferase MiaA [Bacteroidia bacterium]|nr:tRNA (adenosine(37)-N6)-dimethylallyltransferase MiaA [Bacteroidia bacterium]